MPRATYIPITGPVLRWAIRESGLSGAEFARRVGTEPETVEAWIAGQSQPTKTQFNRIVSTLKRPSAAFFLPQPPQHLSLPPPLRRSVGARARNLTPQERREIRWARRIQQLIAHLRLDEGVGKANVPRVSLATEPDRAARTIRDWLGVSMERQAEWRNPTAALAGWRAALEDAGVIVAFLQLGSDAIRGFALWSDYAPLVAINSTFIPQARAFTLFHEVGHLLLREDSASDEQIGVTPSLAMGSGIERWCERLAACVLLPESAVRGMAPTFMPASEGYETARQLAQRFKTSVRAAAVRLIELDLAPDDLYALVVSRSNQLDRRPSTDRGGGRPAAQARFSQVGRTVARRIVDAVSTDRLSERDARDVLRLGGQGFQDLASLVEIR